MAMPTVSSHTSVADQQRRDSHTTLAVRPEGSAATSRWFGVGHSFAPDPAAAAHEALDIALRGHEPSSAALAMVFASQAYCTDELLTAIHRIAPGVQVIGCSSAGEIASIDGHVAMADDSLVIAVLGGQVRVGTSAGKMNIGVPVRDAAANAAKIIDAVTPSPFRAILALTDGMSVHDQSEIVRGVYETAGATVPLVGGCAGDDLRMQSTAQMIGRFVATDAFVLAAIGSDSPMGVGVAHGWRSVGDPMFVTAVEGTTVVELDGRPAMDVYLERLGADPAIGADAEAFSAFALTHPLAHVRRRGDEVRWVSGGDIERRTLQCAVEIPRSAQVWLTEGDCQSTIDAVGVACSQALEQLGDAKPIGAIAFNCVARRAVLGDHGLAEEVDEISKRLGSIPVAGFYTYGEFARTRGPNGFHNQTLVTLVFS